MHILGSINFILFLLLVWSQLLLIFILLVLASVYDFSSCRTKVMLLLITCVNEVLKILFFRFHEVFPEGVTISTIVAKILTENLLLTRLIAELFITASSSIYFWDFKKIELTLILFLQS